MHQLAQIADIIEETLDGHDVENAGPIANELAQKLVQESLEQLAFLLGTELHVDESGETTLNLGVLE